MFNFIYNYCDHADYLQLLAQKLGVPVSNNTLWFPKCTGTGYVKMEELPNGLQVLINECTLHQDFFIYRNASKGHAFTLRFDEVRNLKALSLKIGDTVLEENTAIYSGAFLSNSFAQLEYTTNAETADRCVNIYFTKEWFDKYLGLPAGDKAWADMLSTTAPSVHLEVLTLEYRALMEDIFELKQGQPLYMAALQNRVMMLLENFFRNLYSQLTIPGPVSPVADDEIKRMVQIEAILAKDVKVPPPSVPELARIAMMSETKLKTLFKKTYRYSLYDYYQKNRMLKAKQLIASRKYSVKEVGNHLGFKNLSNFTIAFKKEFNKLPSEM